MTPKATRSLALARVTQEKSHNCAQRTRVSPQNSLHCAHSLSLSRDLRPTQISSSESKSSSLSSPPFARAPTMRKQRSSGPTRLRWRTSNEGSPPSTRPI
eukprot:Amastigsp_a844642_10.p5 type:complete len:100 gc:universal Amastigsp_a844642_10:367-666(+)